MESGKRSCDVAGSQNGAEASLAHKEARPSEHRTGSVASDGQKSRGGVLGSSQASSDGTKATFAVSSSAQTLLLSHLL